MSSIKISSHHRFSYKKPKPFYLEQIYQENLNFTSLISWITSTWRYWMKKDFQSYFSCSTISSRNSWERIIMKDQYHQDCFWTPLKVLIRYSLSLRVETKILKHWSKARLSQSIRSSIKQQTQKQRFNSTYFYSNITHIFMEV